MDFHARAVIETPEPPSWWPWPTGVQARWRRSRSAMGLLAQRWSGRSWWATPDVDAVVIATPNVLHAPQSIAFLEAGQHVLVEKPMAMNAAEGELMVAAADGLRRRG